MKSYESSNFNPLAGTLPDRLRHLKLLWICAFLLHAVLDPLITYISIRVLDTGYESNAFMRVWLNDGIGSFLLIHIPLFLYGVVGFLLLRWLLKLGNESQQAQVYYLSVGILGGAIIWGGVVVINNMWVLWTGL
jgi:hypothetical protein